MTLHRAGCLASPKPFIDNRFGCPARFAILRPLGGRFTGGLMRTLLVGLFFLLPTSLFADQNHGPQSAEYCGDCHRAIYEGWKQSAHATAMESRLFQDALKMAELDFKGDARAVCLRCHSPLAASSG